jgi:hypothetical protein
VSYYLGLVVAFGIFNVALNLALTAGLMLGLMVALKKMFQKERML